MKLNFNLCSLKRMYKRIYPIILIHLFILILVWTLPSFLKKEAISDEKIKIALRGIGDELLHSNQDSTSLVLPITKTNNIFKVQFENHLSFDPGRLVELNREKFETAQIPKPFSVEVIQCSDGEVAHSYQINPKPLEDFIACSGRNLPLDCYTIEVKIGKKATSYVLFQPILTLLIFISLIFFYLRLKGKSKELPAITNEEQTDFVSFGKFEFHIDQNKLVIYKTEIELSKKECELLVIFSKNLNKVVKREDLTKQVWEDNGVVVGRSLDTYISKLRKKLKTDESIQLMNIHGVGYKLSTKA